MTTNTHPSPCLAFLAFLTASGLIAVPAAGAVGAATGAVNQIGISTVGTLRSTAGGAGTATVSTFGGPNAAGRGVATVNAAYGLRSPTGISANGSASVSANPNLAAAGSDYDTIGMREERLQMRADAAASSDVKAIGQVVSTVRTTAYEDRKRIDSEIANSIEETRKALSSDETHVSAAAAADYAAARAEVHAREAALAESLTVARAASGAEWASARDDVAVSYSLYATAAMRSRVIAAAGSARASGALDSSDTVASIRSAQMGARTQLATDIQGRLASAEKALEAVRKESNGLAEDAKESYLTAVRVAAHREREVKHALSAAERAGGSDWARARNEVAVAYAGYAEAVSRAELAAAVHGAANVIARSSSAHVSSDAALLASDRN